MLTSHHLLRHTRVSSCAVRITCASRVASSSVQSHHRSFSSSTVPVAAATVPSPPIHDRTPTPLYSVPGTVPSSAYSTRTTRPFLFLAAPLEDVSESSFRRLMYTGGADMTFTEMARVENLARKAQAQSGTSWAKVEHSLPNAGPAVVQLLCGNENSLRQFLDSFKPDPKQFAGFNLNLGCPSPAILALGLGAQAIKRIAKTQRYVELLNEWIEQKCTGAEWKTRARPTVSLKLRIGANEREKKLGSHVNLIRALNGNPLPKRWKREREGDNDAVAPSLPLAAVPSTASSGPVSHFILHGRHGKQHYETPCDFTALAAAITASEASNIVVNGDIHQIDQVVQAVDMGAAGVMIGRAAVKDPYIFSRLKVGILKERPDIVLLNQPTRERRSIEFRDLYLSYGKEYHTFQKYIDNVSGRIGQPFEPNPKVQLNERTRVELQGRAHPDYKEAVERDRTRLQGKKKPYEKQRIDYRTPMEQQMQDSVQG